MKNPHIYSSTDKQPPLSPNTPGASPDKEHSQVWPEDDPSKKLVRETENTGTLPAAEEPAQAEKAEQPRK